MHYPDILFSFDNLYSSNQLRLDIGDVFQVSELSLIRGGEIYQHTQHCDEITYVVSGESEFISDGKKEMLSQGQIHFIRKGLTHSIKAMETSNFRYICIGYIPNMENPNVKAFYDSIDDIYWFTLKDNGTVKNLTEYIIREFYNRDSMSNYMINSYLTQILVCLMRMKSGKELIGDTASKKTVSYALYKTLRYVDREYMNITATSQVAKHLSYSEYYISRLFRDKMDMTLKEYITYKKILSAQTMLKTTDLTVEKIAEQAGFSCAYSFRRAFKKHTGTTPCEYRKFCSYK